MKPYRLIIAPLGALCIMNILPVTFEDIEHSIRKNKLKTTKEYLVEKFLTIKECYELIRIIAVEGDSDEHIELIQEIYKHAGTLYIKRTTNETTIDNLISLEKGQSIIAQHREKHSHRTDLSYALVHNNVNVFAFLMKADNKKLLKKIGCNLIQSAVILNRVPVIKLLLEHEVPIDCTIGEDENSIWHTLATMDSSSITEIFALFQEYYEKKTNQKIDLEIENNYKETPLMQACGLACRSLRNENLRYLLKQGGDITTKNKFGDGLLHRAVLWNCKGTIEILLENGIDPNARDRNDATPLHIACDQLYPRSVSQLLQHKKIIIDAQNKYGNTPLHILLKKNVTEIMYDPWKKIIKRLLEAGSRWDIVNDDGVAPIHYCIEIPWLCTTKHFKKIINAHSNFDWSLERTDTGDTLAHQLIKKSITTEKESTHTIALLKVFIEHNISLNHKNNDGDTPLSLCSRFLKKNESNKHYIALYNLLSSTL